MTSAQITKLINHAQATLAFGSSLLLLPAPARLQAESEEAIIDLDQMVIVANRSEVPLNQVGSTVEILDRHELAKTEQTFLLNHLRYVPGFYLRNNGSPGAPFGITTRGLNANPPTVLIDGIEVDNPASGQMINLGTLFGGNVSRIEILKGPQSSLYGANALSGVISIQTQDGRTDPGSTVSASYGSHDTLTGNVSTRGAEGALSYAFALSYFDQHFSVQDPSFGPEWEDEDRYENTQATLKLDYALNQKSSLNFLAYWLDTYSDFDPGDPNSLFGPPESVNFSESTHFFSRVGADSQISDSWASSAGIAFNNTEAATVTGGRFPNDGKRYTYDWKNSFKPSSQWTIASGLEYEEEYNDSGTESRTNGSIFFENVIHAGEDLTLTLGGRHDDSNVYGEENTWRTTFSYLLSQEGHQRIRGSYGTSFQAPSFFQLFSAFGSPDLDPESGKGWDLAYEQTFAEGKVFFSTTLFGNDVTDKIVFSFDSFTYANEDSYASEGLETALRFQVNEKASATLAHTYSDAQYRDGTEAERVPRNLYSASLDLEPADFWNVSLTALVVSSQYGLRTSTEKQEGYFVVNLATQYNINDTTRLWLRIDNLFDEDYQEILTYQTYGFSLYGGVRLNF